MLSWKEYTKVRRTPRGAAAPAAAALAGADGAARRCQTARAQPRAKARNCSQQASARPHRPSNPTRRIAGRGRLVGRLHLRRDARAAAALPRARLHPPAHAHHRRGRHARGGRHWLYRERQSAQLHTVRSRAPLVSALRGGGAFSSERRRTAQGRGCPGAEAGQRQSRSHTPHLRPPARPPANLHPSARSPPRSSLPFKPALPFSSLFPSANPAALDLLSRLLLFSPDRRISVEAALAHPYLASLHDPTDEPLAGAPFSFDFERTPMDKGALQALIRAEMCAYHPELARGDRAAGGAGGAGHGAQAPAGAAGAAGCRGGGSALAASGGGGCQAADPTGCAPHAQQAAQPMEQS